MKSSTRKAATVAKNGRKQAEAADVVNVRKVIGEAPPPRPVIMPAVVIDGIEQNAQTIAEHRAWVSEGGSGNGELPAGCDVVEVSVSVRTRGCAESVHRIEIVGGVGTVERMADELTTWAKRVTSPASTGPALVIEQDTQGATDAEIEAMQATTQNDRIDVWVSLEAAPGDDVDTRIPLHSCKLAGPHGTAQALRDRLRAAMEGLTGKAVSK